MSYNESNFPHPNICTIGRSLHLRSASVSSNRHSRFGVTQFNLPDDLQLHLPLLQVMLDDGGRCSVAEKEALDLCIQVLGSSSRFPGLRDIVLYSPWCWGPWLLPLLKSSEEKLGISSLGLIRAWSLTHVASTLALNGWIHHYESHPYSLSDLQMDYQHHGLTEIEITWSFVMETFWQGCWQWRNSRSMPPHTAIKGGTEVLAPALSLPNYSKS